MPALFAYLLTISIFIGGGYAGLHFLAGDFDAPPLPAKAEKAEAAKSEGVKSDGRMQSAKARPPSSQAIETASKPKEVAATSASTTSAAKDEQPVVSAVQPTLAHAAPAEPAAPQAETNILPPVPASSSSAAHEPPVANPAKTTESATEQVASALGKKSGAGLPAVAEAPRPSQSTPAESTPPKSSRAEASPMDARAAMKPSPRRKQARAVRERIARTDHDRPRPASPSVGSDFFGRSAPVEMVLRTIELPDGRRVRQLLTQDQARMDDD